MNPTSFATAAHATAAAPVSEAAGWQGGASPWGVSWQKLMMWMFIITDGLLFAGFLAGYGFARFASDRPWPDQSHVFHLNFITAMTFILITSSATMACAVSASKHGDKRAAVRFLLLTALGGLAFLAMQAIEWTTFIGEGARLDTNPWGIPAFSSYFFMMTGFHGTHVLLGVIILLLTTLRTKSGKASAGGVELTGLYWHFVDLVWVFIFGCFYLV